MNHAVGRTLLALVICGLLASAAHAESTGTKVYREMRYATVGLENMEGSGTGMIISEDGYILTNAHVVSSPLPFKCKVDVPVTKSKDGKDFETIEFKRVKIIGFHPKMDMALVKIDPKEQNIKLQACHLSKAKAVVGQDVYAIGNPGAGSGHQILDKTITSGVISNTDRVVDVLKDGVSYYQHSAAINHGNSGGPLINENCEVIGINTAGLQELQGVFFATPIYELNFEEFTPTQTRKTDREMAKKAMDAAQQYYQRSKNAKGEEADYYRYLAFKAFHAAIAYDSSNAENYYNVGMILRTLNADEVAAAYLLQAVSMKPWGSENGDYYRELGFALVKQKKYKEALAAWEEGAAKTPLMSAKIYEDMAIYWNGTGSDPYKAALDAAVVEHLQKFGTRIDDMKRLHRDSEAKLNDADKKKLNAEIAKLDAILKEQQAKSDKEQNAKHPFITSEFAAYVRDNGSMPDDPAKNAKMPIVKLLAPGANSGAAVLMNAVKQPDTGPAGGDLDLKIPEGSRSLLVGMDPAEASVKQSWKYNKANALVTPSFPSALLQFPLKPPAEYDLTMIVERESSNKEFLVGLVRNGKQTMFTIDKSATISGLDLDAVNAYQQPVLPAKKPVLLVFQVLTAGLRVTADGKEIFRQVSKDDFPAVTKDWETPDSSKLFLGANGSRFVIHKIMITSRDKK